MPTRALSRCAALVLGTLAALAAGELLVRAVGAGGTTLSRGRLHAYDAQAGWTCQPGLDAWYSQPGSFNVRVVCNSRGLRDGEKIVPKPAGTTRAVFLGDSFTWGYGVENDEAFPAIVARSLPGLDSVNLGVNGYSTVQSLVRLETEGLRYEPDWVVLSFCHNDLEDNTDDKDGGRPFAALGPDGAVRIENRPVRAPWKSPGKQWLRHNLRLWNLAEYVSDLRRLAKRDLRRETGPKAEAPDPEGGAQVALAELYTLPTATVDRAWEIEAQLLRAIDAVARGAGARLLVVNVATEEAVDGKVFARSVAERVEAASQPDPDRPGERLGRLCAEAGIAYLDLVPAFRNEPDPRALFLHANGHWSAAGHRLAGQGVAQALAAAQSAQPPP